MLFINISLACIRNQKHHNISALGGFGHRENLQSVGFRLGLAFAAFVQANDHVLAVVPRVERMRVSLAAVTDDSDGLALKQAKIRIIVVIECRH